VKGCVTLKRDFQPGVTVCRYKTRDLIAGERQILNRWAEYFEERLSSNSMHPLNAETVIFGPELHIPVATFREVYGAFGRMENNRVPGGDAITAELIKEGGRCL
jgi:hypothetical protein